LNLTTVIDTIESPIAEDL